VLGRTDARGYRIERRGDCVSDVWKPSGEAGAGWLWTEHGTEGPSPSQQRSLMTGRMAFTRVRAQRMDCVVRSAVVIKPPK
jgi:hypothetical protein